MATLVPSPSKFTTALSDHFDTFKEDIVINKEPLKTITAGTSNTPAYAGYRQRREDVSYTYTAQSGVYSAIVNYGRVMPTSLSEDGKFRNPEGKATIKVESDARNYINTGKTESIVVDGKTFNINAKESVQNFLGAKYYIFEIMETS